MLAIHVSHKLFVLASGVNRVPAWCAVGPDRGRGDAAPSGFNFLPVFELLLAEVGIDRIMFSADHPFASMTTARTFLDGLPISDADREQIAHSNAERLFNL